MQGSATVNAEHGTGGGELEFDEKDLDMEKIAGFYMDVPPSTPEPVDEPEPANDGPTDAELAAARGEASSAMTEAKSDLREEKTWTGLELSRTENDLENSPPNEEEKPLFDAYLKALRDRLDYIDRTQRAMPGLDADFREADVASRSSVPQRRREALADFEAIRDNAEDVTEGLRERPEAPRRARRRNRFNARREGAGFVGNFADFPDWSGYPTVATRHPANDKFTKNDGAIPQPRGEYHVPGPETPGNKHTAPWRRLLYGERDVRKQALENDFRAKNPGIKVPDLTAQANADTAATYAGRGYPLTWDELDLQGFEEHHIWESSWGGPHADSNLIYVRLSEHYSSTSWWEARKGDIFDALHADDR